MKKFITLITCIILVFSMTIPVFADREISTTPSGILKSELEEFVDNYVEGCIGQSTAGASISIWQDGELILNKAYGVTDIESGTPVNTDNVFEWGSATKLLVWTSIMQLYEQGLLDLNTDIRTYLPKGFFSKLSYDTPITIFNLMHHNAGWEDKNTDLYYKSPQAVSSLADELKISEPNQVHEPGSIVAYSNYGTALAAYLVELASQQPFYDYVQDNIFSILDMTETSVHPTQMDNALVESRRDSIKGHTLTNDGLELSSGERVYIGMYPAGSAIGTSADAAKFLAALMPGTGETSPLFASNDTLEEMLTTSYYYGGDVAGNAHGFWESLYAVRTVGHGGNTDSFSSNLTLSPDSRFAVVVMTNQAVENKLCYGLTQALYGAYEIEYSGALPDTAEVESTYIIARRTYTGFTKFYDLIFNRINVVSLNDRQIKINGSIYTQVNPYLYYYDDSEGNAASFYYFTVDNGTVTLASAMSTDMMPINDIDMVLIISGILLVLCTLFVGGSLIIHIIGGLRNRKNKIPSTLFKKLNLGLTLAELIALTNNVILLIRTMGYVSYSAILIHFGINIAFILVTLASPLLLNKAGKKNGLSKRQTIFYILNCIAAIVISILLIGWEFYH